MRHQFGAVLAGNVAQVNGAYAIGAFESGFAVLPLVENTVAGAQGGNLVVAGVFLLQRQCKIVAYNGV